MKKYGKKIDTNFCGLDMAEGGAKCESFTIISIDLLLMKTNITSNCI